MGLSRPIVLSLAAVLLLGGAGRADVFDGSRKIYLKSADGAEIEIGSVEFKKIGDKITFALDVDRSKFKDFFLSMREFKCLEGKEVQCYVPYPYPSKNTVSNSDLSWLETNLIFLYKSPAQFGATLGNGLYYKLERTPEGLEGRPYAVDLNAIAAPPDDDSTPPFPEAERQAIDEGSRWLTKLIIK